MTNIQLMQICTFISFINAYQCMLASNLFVWSLKTSLVPILTGETF